MKILPTTSLAVLVASLWTTLGPATAAPLQDTPPAGPDGGMNQAMEIPPAEPEAPEPEADGAVTYLVRTR